MGERKRSRETGAERFIMKSWLMIIKADKPKCAKLTFQFDSESWNLLQNKKEKKA